LIQVVIRRNNSWYRLTLKPEARRRSSVTIPTASEEGTPAMSESTDRTNEADIAAVTDVVLAYYEGMTTGNEVKLARAFHPRACVVGNFQGKLEWQTLEDFVDECKEAAGTSGAYGWRIESLSFQGDTALVRLGAQFAGDWYSDDLSMLRIDGAWCIVHKTWYVHPRGVAETP
jgi:putative lumazine-binding protein